MSDSVTSTTAKKPSKIAKIFSWIFGIIFLLSALSIFVSPASGILYLLAGLSILPPVNNKLRKSIPFLKGWIAAFVAFILAAAGGAALSPSEVDDVTNYPSVEQTKEVAKAEENSVSKIEEKVENLENATKIVEEPIKQEIVATTQPEVNKENETASQKNAVRKAKSYIDFSGFSRTGLIKQLEFEEFSTEDSTYAVDKIEVDWNEQAAKKAKSYTDFSGFSRQGLIDQLIFEGFTEEQAAFGATSLGL